MHQHALTTRKNSTDSAMIIDAMDLLYADNVEGFALVSSDCDFASLAMRLRAGGKFVHGLGEAKTPAGFANACDKFVHLETLGEDDAEADPRTPKQPRRGRRPADASICRARSPRRSTPSPATTAGPGSARSASTCGVRIRRSTPAPSGTTTSARW